MRRVERTMDACFLSIWQDIFLDVLTEIDCTFAHFCMPNNLQKPIMFKYFVLLWRRFPQHDISITLLIDDSNYKAVLNPYTKCISPHAFRSVDFLKEPIYLTNAILPWLTKWNYITTVVRLTQENQMLNPFDHNTIPMIEKLIRNKEANS